MKGRFYRISKVFSWIVILVLVCCLSGCVSTFDVTSDVQMWETSKDQSPRCFAGVCKAVKQTDKGSFMVTCGDIVPPKRVYDVIQTTLSHDYTWYPVVGNHNIESQDGMQWIKNYVKENLHSIKPGPEGSEETTYSFNYKNAHIIVLNEYYDGKSDTGTDGDICDSLYQWLEKDLQANTKPFIFVFGHEPFVVVGDIDNGVVRHLGSSLDLHDENKNINRTLKLFREYYVTAYICGHTHTFSHAKINGTWHVNAGHSMGCRDDRTSSTFLKVNIGMFRCWIDVYRLDKNKNFYQRNYVVNLD
jgi:predicted phosphodiesterase